MGTPPKELKGKAVFFGDMAKGGYMRTYRNDEWRVSMTVKAETRNAVPTTVYFCDDIEGEFSDWPELREAMIKSGVQQGE